MERIGAAALSEVVFSIGMPVVMLVSKAKGRVPSSCPYGNPKRPTMKYTTNPSRKVANPIATACVERERTVEARKARPTMA